MQISKIVIRFHGHTAGCRYDPPHPLIFLFPIPLKDWPLSLTAFLFGYKRFLCPLNIAELKL